MGVTTRTIGKCTVLDCSGNVVLGSATEALHNAIHQAVQDGFLKVVVNLGDVSRIDSSGLGEFPTHYVTPFIHFLVGFAHARATILGIGVGGTFLTLMPGFGMDVNLNRRFAIRAFQADYPVLHGDGEWSYKNLRLGGGLVVRF